MRKRLTIIILFSIVFATGYANSLVDSVRLQVSSHDTFYLARMHDIYVYPKMVFKSKSQERFYWRTVRDVKKTLPFAKELAKEIALFPVGIH